MAVTRPIGDGARWSTVAVTRPRGDGAPVSEPRMIAAVGSRKVP